MARLIMMVGLPGSGKSTIAERYKNNEAFFEREVVIHSSDSIREELFGERDQTQNQKVFDELHSRVKRDLDKGLTVIYDATNLSRKKRRHVINNIAKGHNVECLFLWVGIDRLFAINQERSEEEKLPREKLEQLVKTTHVPLYEEGFKKIEFIDVYDECYSEYKTVGDIIEIYRLENYDQNNKYHSLSLGGHLRASVVYAEEYSKILDYDYGEALQEALKLHDIGKPYCREDKEDGSSSYIGHECVSAYSAVRYLMDENDFHRNHVLLLISYHMRMHNVKTPQAETKIINEVGLVNYAMLQIAHQCDLRAH